MSESSCSLSGTDLADSESSYIESRKPKCWTNIPSYVSRQLCNDCLELFSARLSANIMANRIIANVPNKYLAYHQDNQTIFITISSDKKGVYIVPLWLKYEQGQVFIDPNQFPIIYVPKEIPSQVKQEAQRQGANKTNISAQLLVQTIFENMQHLPHQKKITDQPIKVIYPMRGFLPKEVLFHLTRTSGYAVISPLEE